MFGNNLSLQNALEGTVATFRRFPLTLLSAFFGTAVIYELVELTYSDREASQYLWKLAWFAWLGLILFFDLEIITERYGLAPKKSWLVFLAGLAVLTGYYFSLPEELVQRHYIQLFLFSLSLHLLASVAAYLNPRTENGFWQFNEKLFLRFLTATLYTTVLYLGLCIAILAITKLFQADFGDKTYVRLWLFMAGVFHPWFFLAGVPRNLQLLETETSYPKGLKVFTQFVLLPLVTVYLLILYGYLLKILFHWSWPRGWVSNLVLSFSIVGIFSLLLIHPIRNTEGNTWIRTYAKWFYRALFPLLVLFALAIWRRVSDYGITEERYFVLVLAFWLLAVALYFLFSSDKNIKFIPVTLCLLAFLVAFGPWGAFGVSQRSQTSRLKYYFQKNGMFSGGKLQPPKRKVSRKDAQEISSILYYLGDKHNFASIRPWFNPKLDSIYAQYYPGNRYQNAQASEMLSVLKINEVLYDHTETANAAKAPAGKNKPPLPEVTYFRFTGPSSNSIHTTGYDYQITANFGSGYDRQHFFRLGSQRLRVENLVEKGRYKQRLFFKWNEKDTSSFDLRPLMRALVKSNSSQPEERYLTAYSSVAKAQLKLYFKTLQIAVINKDPETSEFELQILIQLPPASASESGK
jgi:hypothetical protein